jgi:hypothetical protein
MEGSIGQLQETAFQTQYTRGISEASVIALDKRLDELVAKIEFEIQALEDIQSTRISQLSDAISTIREWQRGRDQQLMVPLAELRERINSLERTVFTKRN